MRAFYEVENVRTALHELSKAADVGRLGAELQVVAQVGSLLMEWVLDDQDSENHPIATVVEASLAMAKGKKKR